MTAIYLLTGKLPQELDTDLQTEELLWQEHALNVSPTLAAVINKAIQYHPRDRYTTAMKMLDALQSVASIPPRQSSTQATLVVSPGNELQSNQPASAILPQTPAVINYPSSKRNWQKPLILGSLLAASTIGAAVIFNFVQNQPPQSSIGSLPPPESTLQQPIARPTPAAQFPNRASEPTKVTPPTTIQSASPPTTVAQQQQQTAETENASLAQQQQQTAETENASLAQQQQQTNQAKETDSASQQKNEVRNKSIGNVARNSVPGFPTGTSESSIKAKLGNPTNTYSGYFPNTRALLYELPNQVTLGYIFDRSSGRLRQTEVAFEQSVNPQVMQATLQGMLGDRTFINVSQGLQKVYDRRANKYSFKIDQLKGVIERNNSDRIYIGVWDADLH